MAVSETIQGILDTVRNGQHGRYRIDDLRPESLRPDQISRIWGVIDKLQSGDISIWPISEAETA
jgi:hypothetical protein